MRLRYKIIIGIVLLPLKISLLILAFIVALFFVDDALNWVWPEANGSINMGDNIYMVEIEGRGYIYFCTELRGRACKDGLKLIPKPVADSLYLKSYYLNVDSTGRLSEKVVDFGYDERWVIAKTNNYKKYKRFYILDKRFTHNITSPKEIDDVIDNYIYEFSDSLAFARACKDKGIKIEW